MASPAWFITEKMGPGMFMIREPDHVQSFLICGDTRALLVDTGMGFRDIRPVVASLTPLPVIVANTHWHFDHIGGNAFFKEICISHEDAPYLARPLTNDRLRTIYLDPCRAEGIGFPRGFDPHAYEIPVSEPSCFLSHGDILDLGHREVRVLATPGHTRGSLSFLDSSTRSLFCGDLVYDGSLYAHFTDSDPEAYGGSLERLLAMSPKIARIFAAHNHPAPDPDILDRALALFTALARGKTRREIIPDWGSPVVRHHYGDLAVLTRVKGEPGIDLLGSGGGPFSPG